MSFVLRLREFFERAFGPSSINYEYSNGSSNNNNDVRSTKSHSLDHTCMPSLNNLSPRVTLYTRPSLLRTLTFSLPKCAHCQKLRKESKRLKKLKEQPGFVEPIQEEPPPANHVNQSDNDLDNGISMQSNLKVNEAVAIFERTIEAKKDHTIIIPRGSAIQVFPYANPTDQSLTPSKLTVPVSQTVDSLDSKTMAVRTFKSFDESYGLDAISENKTEDHISPSVRESSRLDPVDPTPDYSLSLTIKHAPPDFISLRTKAQHLTVDCNEDLYQSLLMEGVPFYQDYNQNAIKRDSVLAQTPFSSIGPGFRQSRRATAVGTLARSLTTRQSFQKIRRVPSIELLSSTPEQSISRERQTLSIVEGKDGSVTVSFSIPEPLSKIPHTNHDISHDDIEETIPRKENENHLEQTEDNNSSNIEEKPLRNVIQQPGGVRWIEMPQVQNYSQLSQVSPAEIKRQEALFEIITSEASYYRSLTVLIEDYMKSTPFDCNQQDTRILQPLDKHMLFSNILEIYETSARFLEELEKHWLKSPLIDDLCHIIRDFAHSHFRCFITYIKNQHYQNSKYLELCQRKHFHDAVLRLQKESQCPGLPLDTFLLLPMQRITRLQLLVKAVLQKTDANSDRHKSALIALGALEKVLTECEHAKGEMHQKQRIVEWSNCLSFSPTVKLVSLSEHQITKLGELDILYVGKNGPPALHRFVMTMRPLPVTIILMNDYVLIAKKRKAGGNGLNFSSPTILSALNNSQSEVKYSVEDGCDISKVDCHCSSHMLPSPEDELELLKQEAAGDIDCEVEGETEGPYTLHLVLHANEVNQCDYRLQMPDFISMERWLDAFTSAKNRHSSDTFEDYVRENYPQAVVTRSFLGTEEDHLDLKDGETIVLLRTVAHSWSKGITRDNRQGWFPAHYVTLILNEDMKTRSTDVAVASKAYAEWCRSPHQDCCAR